MLPGKKYTPEDLVALLWRRRWLLVVPVVLSAMAAGVVSQRMPDLYESETVVLIVPQRVSEAYVRPTVTARIQDRVLSIREQILSRSRLERIVHELDLFPVERARNGMDAVIALMRSNVDMRVVREDAFSVSYVAADPRVAQAVVERLAGMIREENMRDREVMAESTNQFLRTELDDAEKRLTERERQLEEYRKRYSGELPEQVASNLQTVQNTELQIQALLQSLNSDRERRMLLDRQLADLSAAHTAVSPPAGLTAAPTTLQQLETAEALLRDLTARLTAQHPDRVHAGLAVERLRSQLAGEQTAAPSEQPRASAAEAARQARMADLLEQLHAVDRQIAQRAEEETRLRAVVAAYRRRVEAAPSRETELIALTRDYETLELQYRGLLMKYEESRVAANLERRQIGEQFQILDPAAVPDRPFTPDRPMVVLLGAAVGLALGLAIVGALELADRSVRGASDVMLCCALPVLVALPPIQTGTERRRATGRRRWAWTAAGAAVTAAAILVVWTTQA